MVYSAKSAAVGTISQFTRRKDIKITTGGTSTPASYQVKVTIAYEPEMQASFQDIRFNTKAGTYIDYWIESLTASTTATIWLELPDAITDPGSDTIWMYYGNAGLSDGGVGNDTFEFFDDFSGDLSKWDIITGNPVITSGELVLTADEVRATTSFSGSVVIHIRNKSSVTNSRANFGAGNVGICSSVNPVDDAIFIQKYITGNYYIDSVNEGLPTQTLIGAYDTSYHDYDFYFLSGTNIVFKVDGSTVGTHTTNLPDEPLKVILLQNSEEAAGTAYYDNIRVRKYIANEPITSVGTAQHQRRTPQFL